MPAFRSAPAAPPPMSDPLRDHVAAALADRYAVEGELGRGAMAVVYRARELRLRRTVALKVLPPDLAFRAGVRERFLREAETAAQLSHPHVVPVYAAGDDGGVAWLAMALVDGETLADRMARPPRPGVDEARRILAEAADALAYAHARGVVHRDVKPENILLERDAHGASGRVVVTDFGIARAAEDDARLTGTGVTLGTPAYMSPEQALGEVEVDGRADQYALGVVAYQLLTGALPFQATNATGMLLKHVGEAPRPVRERAPAVPPALAAAVERALAKKPADRWPDAGAFRDALLRDTLPRDVPAPRAAPVAAPVAAPMAAPAAAPPLPAWMPPRARAEDEFERLRGDRGAHGKRGKRAAREARDEWKEYARAQREAERERREEWREAARSGLMPAPLAPGLERRDYNAFGPDGLPAIPLDVRARLFRSKAVGSLVVLAFLFVINAMHLFVPPWVVFPAWGILGGLRRRWRPLGAAGLDFWDVMLGGGAAPALASPAESERRLAADVRRVRSRSVFAVIAWVLLVLPLVVNRIPFHLAVLAGLVVLAAMLAPALVALARLRSRGVSAGDVFSRRWRAAVHAAVPRPHDAVVDEEVRQLAAAASVHNGSLALLRDAVEDRVTVRETLAKLSAEDRALLPVAEVMPTVDGLVERVADLAGRLERFPADASPAALSALDARLAAPAPATPEGARTRELLERQRASLADLIGRRAALEARLESARAALRNVRLDLLKLRDEGVGAIGPVSTATQEARALSRDIANALAAAAEARDV